MQLRYPNPAIMYLDRHDNRQSRSKAKPRLQHETDCDRGQQTPTEIKRIELISGTHQGWLLVDC
jgi:hypothetical protein